MLSTLPVKSDLEKNDRTGGSVFYVLKYLPQYRTTYEKSKIQ